MNRVFAAAENPTAARGTQALGKCIQTLHKYPSHPLCIPSIHLGDLQMCETVSVQMGKLHGRLQWIGRTLTFSSTSQSQLGCSRISISPLKSMMQTPTYLSSYLLLWSLSIQFIHLHCASWDAAWRDISFFDCWSLWAGYFSYFANLVNPKCTLPWMTSSLTSYENSTSGQTMPRSHLHYRFCTNKQFLQKYTTETPFKLRMAWVSKYQPSSILASPKLIHVPFSFSSAFLSESKCSEEFWKILQLCGC